MGRRPNPLIGDFFVRGAKLANSSNRYHHTCKRCGQEFPKGRIDSLTTHLLRKCPNLTNGDRHLLFEQIHSSPARDATNRDTSAAAVPLPLPVLLRQHESMTEPSLPSSQQPHEQSALDTLAEVSRRHLDYSSHTTARQGTEDSRGKTLSEAIAEQTLITELSNHGYTSQPTQESGHIHRSPTNAVDTLPLVQTATAASQHLEQHNLNPTPLPVDPQLSSPGEFGGSAMTWLPTNPMRRPAQSKKRGRFNDTRRKQVSDIRKQGACMRCRMLRKACSGETPCSTCRDVGSARLWKTKCLRTRLAEEGALWGAGVFRERVERDVAEVVSGVVQSAAVPSGRVLARLFPQDAACLDLSVRAIGDVASGAGESGRIESIVSRGTFLLYGEDNLVERLGFCITQIVDAYVDEERSPFMHATLQQASTIAQAGEPDAATRSTSRRQSRPSYTLHTQLLPNVIELWILTNLLSKPDQHPWTFHYQPTNPQTQSSNGSETQHPDIIIPTSSRPHRLLTAQLQAAIEARCSKLSKTIMHELERRLLQRQQVSRFATFIASVILLACAERMADVYEKFSQQEHAGAGGPEEEKDEKHSPSSTTPSDAQRHPPNPHCPPLSTSPSSLVTQSQHFASLLNTLLRMRGLPPKTIISPETGTLAIASAALPRASLPNAPLSAPLGPPAVAGSYEDAQEALQTQQQNEADAETREAAAWLDSLRLKGEGVLGATGWDMRFVRLLLAPEGMG